MHGSLTVNNLFEKGMLTTKDEIVFKNDTKEVVGGINEEGCLYWIDEDKETHEFDSPSAFCAFIDRSVEPVSKSRSQVCFFLMLYLVLVLVLSKRKAY